MLYCDGAKEISLIVIIKLIKCAQRPVFYLYNTIVRYTDFKLKFNMLSLIFIE